MRSQSKRRHDTAGGFDALVRAMAGLGTDATWAKLPPATAPGSLGRTLGQGLIQGRRPHGENGTRPIGASPQPVEQMRHEGQRSVAELGAIVWHAIDGARDAPELEPWLTPPHADPIVALTLSRGRLAEYGQREVIDRSCAFPGGRVWLIEIERAKGDVPAGIAVWRSRGADGEWKTRCACVWTHGRIGSATHPLVIGAQWDIHGNHAVAGACVLGPSWEDAARATRDASRAAMLARRQNAIGSQMIARIVVPAALAWLDHHGGVARPAGRFAPGGAVRTVQPVAAVARTPPPPWTSADADRAVEAIVIGAAREGFRIGASCPVQAWRAGWAGYAEMGAVAWQAIADPKAQIDSDAWCAMEHALGEGRLETRSAHPALEAISALVRKMLEQTERNHVARATDARTLCGLEIPARLWRALAEAGPCPQPHQCPELGDRWWLVEIEDPADDEPNAIALWDADGDEVTLAAYLGVDDGQGRSCITVLSWRTTADGERTHAGLAALRSPVHVDDPHNAESRAGRQIIIDSLTQPDTGSIARVKTAIALHLENDGEPTPLGSYRPSTAATRARNGALPALQTSITALFALERAPDPEAAQEHATGEGRGASGNGGFRARHHVRAHWKRQAFGPQLSHRRWIVVEPYARGPAPAQNQIVVTRLPERATN